MLACPRLASENPVEQAEHGRGERELLDPPRPGGGTGLRKGTILQPSGHGWKCLDFVHARQLVPGQPRAWNKALAVSE